MIYVLFSRLLSHFAIFNMLCDVGSDSIFSLRIPGETTVGRGRTCDIVIEEPSVSKRHAAIDLILDDYGNIARASIEDFSSFGTFVGLSDEMRKVHNSKKLLNFGDCIRFGNMKTVYVFENIQNDPNDSRQDLNYTDPSGIRHPLELSPEPDPLTYDDYSPYQEHPPQQHRDVSRRLPPSNTDRNQVEYNGDSQLRQPASRDRSRQHAGNMDSNELHRHSPSPMYNQLPPRDSHAHTTTRHDESYERNHRQPPDYMRAYSHGDDEYDRRSPSHTESKRGGGAPVAGTQSSEDGLPWDHQHVDNEDGHYRGHPYRHDGVWEGEVDESPLQGEQVYAQGFSTKQRQGTDIPEVSAHHGHRGSPYDPRTVHDHPPHRSMEGRSPPPLKVTSSLDLPHSRAPPHLSGEGTIGGAATGSPLARSDTAQHPGYGSLYAAATKVRQAAGAFRKSPVAHQDEDMTYRGQESVVSRPGASPVPASAAAAALGDRGVSPGGTLTSAERQEVEKSRGTLAEGVRMANKALGGVIEFNDWKKCAAQILADAVGGSSSDGAVGVAKDENKDKKVNVRQLHLCGYYDLHYTVVNILHFHLLY